MKEKFIWASLAVFAALISFQPCRGEKKEVSGQAVFKQYCASCHAGGGNSVNAKRPLAGSSKLVSIVTFKDYLSAPPGHMPYYQAVVNDEATLSALYKYCKDLSKKPGKQAHAGSEL